jgi:hypothetical protein
MFVFVFLGVVVCLLEGQLASGQKKKINFVCSDSENFLDSNFFCPRFQNSEPPKIFRALHNSKNLLKPLTSKYFF